MMAQTKVALGVLGAYLTLIGVEGDAFAQFTLDARATHAVGADPYGVTVGDFDKDGRPDLAVVSGTASTVSILLRAPAGGFVEETGSPFAVGLGPNFAVTGDLNGDQLPDLAVSNYATEGAGGVSIFLRQAAGGFVAAPSLNVPNATGIALADFNADQRPDLVVAKQTGLSVFLRNGAGEYVAETAPSVSTARYVAVADFNADGKPDLVVTNDASDTVAVFLRTATGFELEGAAIAVGDGPTIVLAQDLNGDGKPDLAVTNRNDGTVTVLLRQATGFSPAQGSPFAVGKLPIGIAAGDFNSDGRPDLAVANNGSGSITLLMGQPAGSFEAQPALANLPSAHSLAVADFDGDGVVDLALTQASPVNSMSVLFNQMRPAPDAGVVDASTDGAPDASATPGEPYDDLPKVRESEDGCSCRQVGTTTRDRLALLPLLAVAALGWRRLLQRGA